MKLDTLKKSFSAFSNFKGMTTCAIKKPYTSKAKSYINYYFILVSCLQQDLLLGVLLFFFIVYFYLIYYTYDYNKLLLIWKKSVISYLIIFIYAFNGYFIINL